VSVQGLLSGCKFAAGCGSEGSVCACTIQRQLQLSSAAVLLVALHCVVCFQVYQAACVGTVLCAFKLTRPSVLAEVW
jgi:hypothetical protein